MKINKITIRGEKQETPADTAPSNSLELKEVYFVGATARGETEKHTIKLSNDDVVEFVFDDGTSWFSSNDTIEEIFPEVAALKRRSPDQEVEIPVMLQPGPGERGITGTVVLKLLKIFARKEVQKTIRQLAEDLEKKQLDHKSGLFRLDLNFDLQKDIATDTSQPFLLFIHGTNSSTTGSFSEIPGTEFWNYITKTYNQHILAFQHETLTKSPLQNVLDLMKQLPANATLHLVSHSRGGIVGDILSRYCASNQKNAGFSEVEVEFLNKEGRADDIRNIKSIRNELTKKNISVQKFIRVACPASGTTLASKRLDHFFNITFNLLGLAIGGSANPVYVAFKNLMACIVNSKDDVNLLPGFEAMNPDSPFIKVLNYPTPLAMIDSPLVIISGNGKANLNFKALVIIASRLFFDSQNDLVVNTASMYNGTKRLAMVQYFFDEGTNVDHFHYFKNPKTNNALMDALKSTGTTLIPGFARLESGAALSEDRNAILKLEGGQVFKNRVTGKRPIAVLVPGIMGSNLSKNGKVLWINYFRFLGGELSDLKIRADDGVEASSLIKTSYKTLADHLSELYDVVTFAYDWRKQLGETASLFDSKIRELLKHEQPIKIVGHSMGGVLVRDFILRHDDTWQKLNKSRGFQLLFLGAPLGGSYRIPYVLFGKDPIIGKLSKIDIINTKKDLLRIFSAFPGLLSLLPLANDGDNDFTNAKTWQKMRKAFGDADWPVPSRDDLKKFETYRNLNLENSKKIDFTKAVYIAGRDKSTPSGYELDENGRLVFLSTGAGDQSVTWESGIPQKMVENNSVYYADVTHGALANEPLLFKAIDEILAYGSTLLLKKTRPVIRAVEESFKTPEATDFDLTAEGIEKTILGLDTEHVSQEGISPLRVSISNGDLRYSAYPLLAGHFINDGILYAERAIDYNLKGALSERYSLGIYPGEIGSSEVIVTGQKNFNGAIIVGLGEPGSLTGYQLSMSVEQGVAKYLLDLNNNSPHLQKISGNPVIGVSSLAIACSYGGLSVEKSLRAVVMGVQNANSKIAETLGESAKTVTHIEFVEQYQDRALACLYVLHEMVQDEDQSLNVVFEKKTIKKLLGSKERLPIDITDEWWTRIHVKLKEYELKEITKDKSKEGWIRGLQFNISTGGAREEQRDLFTSREIIQELIEDMSGNNQWTPQLAKTIFELLVPNDFKEQLKKQANINWIVDKDTASYPWELLQDSTHNASPLCINAGMVRQLATEDYRVKIRSVAKNSALIIADPDLKGFASQLQGALEEGEMVSGIFEKAEFKSKKISRGSAAEIIQALFSDDYKIIHLAGHGVFNEDPSKGSGMLIGNNVFLSTREISQMSSVPELVFVNCCYLGKTDGAAEALYRNRFKLAANIGTQLIENGVKAVIAAGWAVDDAAATEFTQVFYEYMFDGYEFGKAVQEARQVIYEKYKYTNTWGAYQCYGDQFYTLRSVSKKAKAKEYVIAREAEIDLNNLLNKLEVSGYRKDSLLQELDDISTAVEKSNIRNGEITESEALAYSGLCMYGEAVSKYESLLNMENASFSFSAMEKYCIVRPKYYVSVYRKNKKDQKKFLELTGKVISDINLLIGYSPSAERLNMLGSACKSQAMLSSQTKSKIEAYRQAAVYYHKAYDKKKKAYSLINWLEVENILVILGNRKWGQLIKMENYSYRTPPIKEVIELLKRRLDTISSPPVEEACNLDWAAVANIKLCFLMLGHKGPGYRAPRYEDILGEYKDTWDKAGSIGKKLGELEHLDFLIDALGQSKKKTTLSLRTKIDNLRDELDKLT